MAEVDQFDPLGIGRIAAATYSNPKGGKEVFELPVRRYGKTHRT